MDFIRQLVSSMVVCCAVCAAVTAIAPKNARALRVLAGLAVLVAFATAFTQAGPATGAQPDGEQINAELIEQQMNDSLVNEAQRAAKRLTAQVLAEMGLDDYEIYAQAQGDAQSGINVTRVRIYLNGESGHLLEQVRDNVTQRLGLEPEIYFDEEN